MVGKRKKEKREQKPHFGSRFLIHINNNVKKKKTTKTKKSTPTAKPRLWLMSYQRNQNNFDFFTQLALLILRGQWG
jgi:hypothetical protein